MCLFKQGDLDLGEMSREDAANQMFVMGAASPIVGFLGQALAAKAQRDAIEERNDAIQESTLENLSRQYRAISRRDQQVARQASQELEALSRETTAMVSTQVVAAAESGTIGASVSEAMGATLQAEGRASVAVRQQLADALVESEMRKDDLHRAAMNKFASLGETIDGPSILGLGVGLYGARLDAFKKFAQ